MGCKICLSKAHAWLDGLVVVASAKQQLQDGNLVESNTPQQATKKTLATKLTSGLLTT